MTERDHDTTALDGLFAAARAAPPPMPPALAARMLADADRALGARRPRPAVAPGWRTQLGEALGGWFGLGGLATACVVGIWIGFAPPAGLPDPVGLWEQDRAEVDLFDHTELALALSEDG